MPRATNNIADVERIDLTTCPGGYVTLRRMTYGQYLHRQQMAMDMQMQTTGKKGSAMSMDINMAQDKVAAFEFATCIGEHNLEDDQGNSLDFRQALHVQMLDPRVGQEIGDNINRMNTFEEAVGN